jgi:DNA-directed RNA polymerase subunit RPC12/RpoP
LWELYRAYSKIYGIDNPKILVPLIIYDIDPSLYVNGLRAPSGIGKPRKSPGNGVVKFSALRPGEKGTVSFTVLGIVKKRTYLGCPHCRSRVAGNFCPKCGKTVEPVEYVWETLRVLDDSDVSVGYALSVPPRHAGKLRAGDKVTGFVKYNVRSSGGREYREYVLLSVKDLKRVDE